MILDQERCILCRRCVRFCREITGTNELGVFNMGDHSVLDVFDGRAARQRLLDLHRGHLPGRRAGEQGLPPQAARLVPEETESVCPSCSNGCNVTVSTTASGLAHDAAPQRRRERDVDVRPRALGLSLRQRRDRLRQPTAPPRRRSCDACPGTRPSTRPRGGSAHRARRATAPARRRDRLAASDQRGALPLRAARRRRLGHRRNVDVAVVHRRRRRLPDQSREGRQRARRARHGPAAGRPASAASPDPRRRSSRHDPRALRARPRRVATLGERLGRGAREARVPDRRRTSNAHPLAERATSSLPGLTFAEKNGTFTNHAGACSASIAPSTPDDQPSDGEIFAAARVGASVWKCARTLRARAVLDEIAAAVPAYAGTRRWDAARRARRCATRATALSGGQASSPSSVDRASSARWTRSGRSRSCAARGHRTALLPQPLGLHPRQADRLHGAVSRGRRQPSSPRVSRHAGAGADGERQGTLRRVWALRVGLPGRLHHHLPGRDRGRDRALSRRSSTSTCRAACSAASARRPARRKRS